MPPAALLALALSGPAVGQPPQPAVYPLAVVGFEERGSAARDLGPKVADLLFARLTARPGLLLVDRADLTKTLAEQKLAAGGLKPADAPRVGRLTGARLLVTGSVVQVDGRLTLVAKVIGTETTRVLGATADARVGDDLGPAVDRLAAAVADVVAKHADKLAPPPPPAADRAAAVAARLKQSPRPAVVLDLTDPTARTELLRFLTAAGFDVIDPATGDRGRAAVILSGEASAESVTRPGGPTAAKARVEMTAVDRRTGKVLVADRQAAVVVDLADGSARSAAVQDAAAAVAERLLPRLTGGGK